MIRLLLTAALAAGATASAQPANPPANAPAPGAAVAARLRAVRALPPRDAVAKLKEEAAAGDDAAAEVVRALENEDARPAFETKIAPFDEAGGLTRDFRDLAKALEAARRADQAAVKIGPLPDAPGGEDAQGWEHRVEVFAGATGAQGRRLPATGVAYEGEYTKDRWKVELGARGLVAPTGYTAPSDGTLEGTVTRQLGKSPFKLFAGAELHQDDLMGLSRHFSLHGGVQAQVLETKRQELTVAFGAGRATELHIDGEREAHPLTLTSVEYGLRLSARAAFRQEFELESNPLSSKDYEFKSVTSVVYDLSSHLAVRAARMIVRRGDPVPGFAGRRDETTIGLILH